MCIKKDNINNNNNTYNKCNILIIKFSNSAEYNTHKNFSLFFLTLSVNINNPFTKSLKRS